MLTLIWPGCVARTGVDIEHDTATPGHEHELWPEGELNASVLMNGHSGEQISDR